MFVSTVKHKCFTTLLKCTSILLIVVIIPINNYMQINPGITTHLKQQLNMDPLHIHRQAHRLTFMLQNHKQSHWHWPTYVSIYTVVPPLQINHEIYRFCTSFKIIVLNLQIFETNIILWIGNTIRLHCLASAECVRVCLGICTYPVYRHTCIFGCY